MTEEMNSYLRINKFLSDLEHFFDIRVLDKGDSPYFNVDERDVFVSSKPREQKKILKPVNGQIAIIPELDFVSKNDLVLEIYSLIASSLSSIQNGCSLKVVGWAQNDFIRLAKEISSQNDGMNPVFLGTHHAFFNAIPDYIINHHHNIEDDYAPFKQHDFEGFSGVEIPQVIDWREGAKKGSIVDDDILWILSPTDEKLGKMVFEDSGFLKYGIGFGISPIYGQIEI